jgi:hypothetical protein
MSDIPKAREMIADIIQYTDNYYIKRKLGRALQLMHRVTEIRRASEVAQTITPDIRRKVRQLANSNPDMTMYEIAGEVGLRNQGRISDILHGKR